MKPPAARAGIIGGSGTFNLNLPDELGLTWVRTLESGMVLPTPFGESPPFSLIEIDGTFGQLRCLTCRMHGWRQGVSRADCSRQVFWVLREAGVEVVLSEGGVGSVNHLLDPRDLIVPHDYLDFSMRKDTGLEDNYLLVMRDAMCPLLRKELAAKAIALGAGRLFDRGVYAVTDGRHFESPAEISFLRMAGADIVGQSLCPEVYLAREIGACFAGIYLVVNYGEGVIRPWSHGDLEEIFYTEGYMVGKVLLETLRALPLARECPCRSLRKETLLKGIYGGEKE